MEKNKIFEQLKGYVEQLEQMSNAAPQPHTQPKPQPKQRATDSYDSVLEKEFVKDEMGQVFARIQFEAAQKYLIEVFMATPEGMKLSEEREQAFRSYKDEKLKDFLESKKAKPGDSPASEEASV